MICFLTSRTDEAETGRLNPANGFVDELRRRFPPECRALFLCSDPDSRETTDYYAGVLSVTAASSRFLPMVKLFISNKDKAGAAKAGSYIRSAPAKSAVCRPSQERYDFLIYQNLPISMAAKKPLWTAPETLPVFLQSPAALIRIPREASSLYRLSSLRMPTA